MKGISTLIVAILLVLIATSLATLFFAWGNEVNEIFKSTTENITQEKISQSQASFFVATVAENKIAIKNNGEVPLDVGDFYVYLNDTLATATPENPSQTKVNPGEMLCLVVSAPDGNYTIRVSGPYGKMDELFDEIAEAWLSGFDYRRNITITESSGNDLTDYQVKISVPCYPHMQSDFSDLRFTDSDKTSPLSYWIESYTPSTSAIVWVKIPSLPASSSKDIYMYYGNTTPVSSESDGTKTFLFFDDFENLGNWNNPYPAYYYTTTVDGRSVLRMTYPSGSTSGHLAAKTPIPDMLNKEMIYSARWWGSNSDMDDTIGYGPSGTGKTFYAYQSLGDTSTTYGKHRVFLEGGSYVKGTTNAQSTWKTARLWINTTSDVWGYYNGELLHGTGSLTHNAGYIHMDIDPDSTSRGMYYDWIFVKQYTSSEPTYAISTNEETH